MNIITIITQYSLLIGILIIIGFLAYQFWIKPKMEKQNKVLDNTKAPRLNDKENPASRISRGFGVMMDKVKESDYVKGIQKEQETASADDMMPKELMQEESQTKKKEEPNPFATDISNLHKVEL